jgi:amidohydrolase
MKTGLFLPLIAFVCGAARAELPPWFEAETKAEHETVIALRRDFHENPELSNGEERTARVVAERLEKLGLQVRRNVGGHGVVAILRGHKPGPCVGLRADMDALPIEEAGALPFKSKQPGVMHACGHDAHTAIALAVAEVLAPHRGELAGTVKFLFQPAEEGMPIQYTQDWGAKRMLREGAFDEPKPRAIFALHCSPTATVIEAGERKDVAMRAGTVGVAAGPISANSDAFSVAVHGKMAHGSSPARGVDAITTAAAIIMELQTIRSRHVDGQEPLVLTVGTMKGGQRSNILAETAEMTGTVRTHSAATQAKVQELIERIAKGVAESHGATVEVSYRKGYPAVVNDAELVARMAPVLRRIAGEANVLQPLAGLGGEDFSFFAQQTPGLYLRLGTARAGVAKPAGLHTPDFDLDEESLVTGVRAMLACVWEELARK